VLQRHAPPLRVRHKLLHHHLHVLARRVVAAARGEEQVERGRVVSALGGGGDGGRDESLARGVRVFVDGKTRVSKYLTWEPEADRCSRLDRGRAKGGKKERQEGSLRHIGLIQGLKC
jgi:hypothetical protein